MRHGACREGLPGLNEVVKEVLQICSLLDCKSEQQ